eukprot:TRINITY_DN11828_c0_g1_i1.p1 TRINITY_DN11828_c0_g1~~TRINITY_DN11828_c0_g1_i1.p1  ORF type:complete len:537 (+),score=42.57 TRINITY_DN11828_c0_g1_i1:170-1780(+)
MATTHRHGRSFSCRTLEAVEFWHAAPARRPCKSCSDHQDQSLPVAPSSSLELDRDIAKALAIKDRHHRITSNFADAERPRMAHVALTGLLHKELLASVRTRTRRSVNGQPARIARPRRRSSSSSDSSWSDSSTLDWDITHHCGTYVDEPSLPPRTGPVCMICLDNAPEGQYTTCSHDHTVCSECLVRCLDMRLAHPDHLTDHPRSCPGHCQEVIPPETFVAVGIGNYLPRLFPLEQTYANPKVTPCPNCNAIVTCRNLNQPQVRCQDCSTSFCFYHGLDHQGRHCPIPRESAYRRFRSWLWLRANTRECPNCHNRIQKNGGCPHMTCRCGYEMCWRCGGQYRRDGRLAHEHKLFPRPRDLKYQCNSKRMWAARVGAVTVGAAVVPAYLAGRFIAIPILVGATYTLLWPARVARRAWTRKERRRQRRAQQLMVASSVCASLREHYAANGIEQNICLTCTHRTTCSHPQLNEWNQCTLCHHYVYDDKTCTHYYQPGSDTCFFCSTQRMTSAAETASTTSLPLEEEVFVRNTLTRSASL